MAASARFQGFVAYIACNAEASDSSDPCLCLRFSKSIDSIDEDGYGERMVSAFDSSPKSKELLMHLLLNACLRMCSFDMIMEVIESETDLLKSNGSKRLAACVFGSGLSPFPYTLYAKGINEVTVIDQDSGLDKIKEKHGEQQGIRLRSLDITSSENGSETKPFDLVVDRATIDLLLSTPGGYDRAASQLKWIWMNSKTPSTIVLVSHSPPDERMDFFLGLYWRDIKVNQVCQPSLEDIILSPLDQSHKASIRDYPYAIGRWEEELELRHKADGLEKQSTKKPVPPAGVLEFKPNDCWIYVLTK